MTLPSLKNQILIAMPQLEDPNFEHSVTYIIDHNPEDGAMGLTISRPLDISLDQIFADLGITVSTLSLDQHQLVAGGPVRPEAGFILHPGHEKNWDSSVEASPGIWLTTSRDILDAIATGNGPAHSIIALGYAGWAPGQLEQELAQNVWINSEANPALLFEVPLHLRWQEAARQLGFDIHLLSTDSGHA